MRNNLDINRLRLKSIITQLGTHTQPIIDSLLDLLDEPLIEILKHSTTARQDDIFIKISPRINGTILNDLVDNSRQRLGVVGVGELRVEEDLGPKEALVAHVHIEQLLSDVIDSLVLFEPLGRLLVVFGELADDIRTHVAVLLLDGLGRLERLLGRYADFALFEKRLDEVGDVATRDWDVLDARADHVAFGYWDYVRHTVA